MTVGATYRLAHRLYPYAKVADQDAARPVRHPVVIVGGGPIGLALALDLGLRGTPALVLDDAEGAGLGSRAICFSKRTLEIADRLGAGRAMLERGVVWNLGKVFHGADKLFEFNLLPEAGHRFPAFINLQQPEFEKCLFDAIERARAQGASIEIRGRNAVTGVAPRDDGVRVTVETPDGPYEIEADWVVACDGARSPVRGMLGLAFEGRVFEDNFLIADVRMTAPFPTERWFWFEPPFEGAGQSALLHRQPDDIWRIDFQLGWDIDREAERDPARVRARIDEFLPDGTAYDLIWTSIYTFQCHRMERFRHGRLLFAGDAAHQVSPFGARGANSGMQDADNLGWKLDLVCRGRAREALLDSYDTERVAGAEENIRNSTRATDFLTPKTEISRIFRDAVLALARAHAFARPMVNSGRLSVPCVYDGLPLTGEDALPGGPARSRPGAPCADAPLAEGFLLDRLTGAGFTLLALDTAAPESAAAEAAAALAGLPLTTLTLDTGRDDPTGLLAERYLPAAGRPDGVGMAGAGGAIYLIRPDQHVVARWPGGAAAPDAARLIGALRRALALPSEDGTPCP
jgi:3-(3-hydroxy-phenyl)propionate hydroxylase